MTRLLQLSLVLVVVVAAAIVLGTGAALPPAVASHFGHDGAADGWMSRAAYLGVMTALVVLLPPLLAATNGLLPRWSRRNRLMRHRDYWLAPPRAAAAEAFLAGHACALGIGTCLFLLGMHFIVAEANAAVPPRMPMPAFYGLLGAFLAIVGALSALVFVRFRTPG